MSSRENFPKIFFEKNALINDHVFLRQDNQTIALTPPQVVQDGLLKTTAGGELEWNTEYSTVSDDITTLENTLSVLDAYIDGLSPQGGVPAAMMQFSTTIKTGVSAVVNKLTLYPFQVAGDNSTWINDLSAIGSNSDLSQFTPIYSGIAFLNLGWAGGDAEQIQISLGGSKINFDWYQIAGLDEERQGIVAPFTAGQTYSLESYYYGDNATTTHQIKLYSITYVYDLPV